MALYTPDLDTIHNPATGLKPPAAWGDAIRNNFAYAFTTKPMARVYHSTTQSVPTATWTTILFNSEAVDIGGCHSTSVNTGRLTVPATTATQGPNAGYFNITGNVDMGPGSNNARFIRILLNGSLDVGGAQSPASAVNVTTLNVSALMVPLSVGDYVELQVLHDHGSNLSTSLLQRAPWFSFTWQATL